MLLRAVATAETRGEAEQPGAELDEEEQSLDRLRRWFRELKARDIFGVSEGIQAEEQLKRCAEALDGYANDVYQAVHAPLGQESRYA